MKQYFGYICLVITLLTFLTFWGEHHDHPQLPLGGSEDWTLMGIAVLSLFFGFFNILSKPRSN